MSQTVTVTYKIDKISQLQYSIANKPSDFAISAENLEFVLKTSIVLPKDYKGIVIITDITGIDKTNGDHLLSFITENKFDILNYNEIIGETPEPKFNVPDNFLINIFSLSIGAARGMLIIRNSGTFLSNTILPIYDPRDILKGIKQSSENVATPKINEAQNDSP